MSSTLFRPSFSKQAQMIEPFRVMKILGEAKALQAQGKEIIHMEIGEPDFPSLNCVHEAAYAASQKGLTHYTPTLGLPELRQKLADFYHSFYRADVSADNIMLTPGSSSALQLILTALLNPGDKVMMADPTYPCNRQFVNLLQGRLLSIPVSEQSRYQLNTSLLEKHWQSGIKAVMVATPANPTGTVIEQNELHRMAHFLAERNAWLVVDEIYQGLVYDRPAESILAHKDLPENVIVINSFSKFFGMTGWRLGWCVAPDSLMPILDRLGQNLYLAAPTPAQYGALRVLEEDALAELESRRQIFESRRNLLYQALQQNGMAPKLMPEGAFYLYWDIAEFATDSERFCADLLSQEGVALTPGIDFSPIAGQHHIRLAYTTDNEKLLEAVERLGHFIAR